MKKLFAYLLFTLVFTTSQAQLVNNGAQITVSNDGYIYVDGNVEHRAGLFLNNGQLYLAGSWANNSSNDGFDRSSNGLVTFAKASASIAGTHDTAFPNLSFLGKSTFQLLANVEAWLSLQLDDAELVIHDGRKLWLNNVDEQALWRKNGVINTNGVGAGFVRSMNKNVDYLYPFGSNQKDILRFITIKPTQQTRSVLAASFQMQDPNRDGFTRSLKQNPLDTINSQFYHIITQLEGNSPLEVSFYTDKRIVYNSLAQWDNGKGWLDMDKVSIVDGVGLPNATRKFNLSAFSFPLGAQIPFAFATKSLSQQLQFFNAFSPDGDGKNDTWEIGNIDNYKDNELKIFDRSGSIVYSVKGYNSSSFWDGQTVDSGSYLYVLRVNINGANQYFKGVITLVKN